MRVFMVLVLCIHGIIHLIGFFHEFKLATIEQFSGKTTIPISPRMAKVMGISWFVACLLFLTATVTFLLNEEWWWLVTIIAIILSQVLILIYWADAKFGTIANILSLVLIILSRFFVVFT